MNHGISKVYIIRLQICIGLEILSLSQRLNSFALWRKRNVRKIFFYFDKKRESLIGLKHNVISTCTL